MAGLGLLVAVIVAAWLSTDRLFLWSRGWFVEYPIPFRATQLVMDVGVADINDDGFLDIFTTNHNYRQDLLIADGKGGFRDALEEWGLEQNPEFRGIEISLRPPEFTERGVYIYWAGRQMLAIRAHKLEGLAELRGTVRSYSAMRPHENAAFTVSEPVRVLNVGEKIEETVLSFGVHGTGLLLIRVDTPGMPARFQLEPAVPVSHVFLGANKVSPRSSDFVMSFQDRHAMAWSHYNDDRRMDVFITRGAISGTLPNLPQDVAKGIRDEFFLSEGQTDYRNAVSNARIEKNHCSGRHAKWVDYDGDGLLDLFINCQDRGHVAGLYPKQLYRQRPDGGFEQAAARAGLELPEHEIVDFLWIDIDNDGDADLVTYESTGLYVYRNQAGRFLREFVGRGSFVRADNPALKGITSAYWFVDGKLSAADFDGDGDFDVFLASKKGNALLVNDGHGRFTLVDPTERGLPAESATANWVDYDNDGLPDLHSVPGGLYRQTREHRFEATGLLALPPAKYMAAIVNWPDFDNDGRRDVLFALNENFSLWPWWKKRLKDSEDRFTWKLTAYRNVGSRNHWLAVKLAGRPGNRDAIGALVSVYTPDSRTMQQVGLNDGAFFSQGHYRLYFGLGRHERAERLVIRWPDGGLQELKDVAGDRLLAIEQDATPRGGMQ